MRATVSTGLHARRTTGPTVAESEADRIGGEVVARGAGSVQS